MSNDGTCLVVADTPANAAGFGRPGTGRGERAGAFPQVRLAGLAECGTHALTAATMGACTAGETTLARDLLPALGEGILVLADRNCRCGLCRPCLRVVHDRACRPWRREFDRKQSSLVP